MSDQQDDGDWSKQLLRRRELEWQETLTAREAKARLSIVRARDERPIDLAGPPESWQRPLADAVETLLTLSWPHPDTPPDGVGGLLLTEKEGGFDADGTLYLLGGGGTRQVRVEFRAATGCVVRVAHAEDERRRRSRSVDPRLTEVWDFSLTV